MANVDVTRIAGNIGALNALNSLQTINKQLALHQTRLSTGKRINSAGDDPAGLTIASKMLARSEGMKVALDNISDASNLLSVAEGGLSKMNDILVQMRNKAEQAASDTLGTTERQAIQTQLSSYAEQIDNIVNETKWNGTKLLDGTVSKQFQTGVDDGESTTWTLSQNHGAGTTGLNISTNVANNTATVSTLGAAATNGIVAMATPTANFSVLETGNYKIEVKDMSASALTGKVISGSTIKAGFTLSATAPGASELANGTNNIQIKNYVYAAGANAGRIDYSVNGGATWTTGATITGTLSTGQGTVALQDSGAVANTGLTLTIDSAIASDTAVYNSSIDYLRMGYAKAQLQTADGNGVTVSNGGNSSAYMYLNGSGTGSAVNNTGRGLQVTADTYANMYSAFGAGTKSSFKYEKANAYSVDVSTATLASNYMNTVSTAMDTVNKSLSSLGSLMARMNFKSDAVATAQVNVEASYNRIMNANMAEEQMNASKYSILQQTGVAMLAQANQAPQSLLSLFR